MGRIIDNGYGNTERHQENVLNRINKAQGSFMKYRGKIWMNKYLDINIKKRFFESLVLSVLFYSLDTVPVRKKYVRRMENFEIKCYKIMIGIDRKVQMTESDLIKILNVKSIESLWKKKRITSYSHIARLPFDNPARIILYGRYTKESEHANKRKFFNLKRNMMKDINSILDVETYCNLCDRKIRNTNLHKYKR